MASMNVKRFLLKTTEITVTTGQTVGVCTADKELVNGMITGHYPSTNQDQLIDSIALASTGIITVTLAAAATADNKITVTVLVKH